MDGKKAFFFCMTVCNHRTGARIGKRCGVVFASNSDEAERIAWSKYGNDDTCLPWAEEIPAEGYEFTVYKSEI